MKMPNWVLLKQRGLRLLQGRKTYKDACDRQWIVSPAEVNFSPPAIYLEDDIHKVTNVQEDSTYEGEMGRLPGGNREHAATIAYQFQNAHILIRLRLSRSYEISPRGSKGDLVFEPDEGAVG